VRSREPETDRGECHKQLKLASPPLGPPRYCSAPVSDRRDRHKSKYTLDKRVPGAFDGETITRRRFMDVTANAAGAIAVGAFTLPALAFALGPIVEQQYHTWVDIGPVGDFTENEYSPVVFTITPGIGETGKTTAYVRKRNAALDTDPADRDTPYIAITTRCAHVGCPVRWIPAAERFVCPCHGGVYDALGRPVSGPPVRPLDRFPTRVRGNMVQLYTGRFSLNSRLRRFSPRDPGEPLDGIGQYLYPSRPSARKL
jgi:menaquinol-cytochrome c reductase iron-sulfur subunit